MNLELLKNEYVRYGLILFIGITIGVVFYPTKNIEEKVSQKYEQQISQLKEQHEGELSMMKSSYDELVNASFSQKKESDRKIAKLSSEVKDLKSKQKTSYYKIVKPDGTIEIKKFSESEVNESTKVVSEIQEEFKDKMEQIETKITELHKQEVSLMQREFASKETNYKNTIAELKSEKSISNNPKKFSLELGKMTNKDVYLHAGMDLWGPVFVGIQGQTGEKDMLGLGLGLRF